MCYRGVDPSVLTSPCAGRGAEQLSPCGTSVTDAAGDGEEQSEAKIKRLVSVFSLKKRFNALCINFSLLASKALVASSKNR